MSKALFLDRDGTIIVDKHYLADPAGVELIPGVRSALQRARELGYKLFLFTNQSGIGRVKTRHTLELFVCTERRRTSIACFRALEMVAQGVPK
jgi:D-glycero-D-manno-heptose 1,7-bisphosphate phosphatase